MNTQETDKQPLSVSTAMSLAKNALENLTVRLVGEVSQVSDKPGYKAVYFTVKDDKAALPCMMWNNRYRSANVALSVGQLVELTGRFTIYAAKGRMNFDVFSIALAGEGNLRLQVANLARKLEAEGLMRPERKRPIPEYPERIGVVTSPRGAVVHDVLRTLRRRFKLSEVLIAGVPVEGAHAAAGIIEGLHCVAEHAEVVLVVRGGGSFEDLMPFNDEQLARAIAACPVPVVTGIGHEPDTTIADMVADVRASTPTGAAETVSPSREQLDEVLNARVRSLGTSMIRRLDTVQSAIARICDRPLFRDPNQLFADEFQTLDVMAEHLSRALPAGIDRDRARLEVASNRLRTALPHVLEHRRSGVFALKGRLKLAGSSLVPRFKTQTSMVAARLHDLSPLAILGRGYAITRDEAGRVVKSIKQVQTGDHIDVSVSDGDVACTVEQTRRIETSVEPWEEST